MIAKGMILHHNSLMRGLIIVDIQKDLLPGGALPVPKGSEVIPYINSIMDKFKTVVSTQRSIQRPYDLNSQPLISAPDYCLHDSVGSELSEDLKITKIHKNFIKGFNPLEGTDSGFKNTYDGLNLYQYLKGKQISEVFVVGLSLDYAVKETALDAHRLGFKPIFYFGEQDL